MYIEDSDVIKNRMLARVPSDVDKSEGSFISDSVSSSAEEFSRNSALLDQLLLRVFAQTAAENGFSEDLEKRCFEFGLTRKPGTFSVGVVEFIGSDGTTIPVDTLVQTESGLQYSTSASVVISAGKAVATVKAALVGAIYNVSIGAIEQMPISIVGVSAVSNTTATTWGTDPESDIDLLARHLFKIQSPSTSGNPNDYKNWSLEVIGIGGAKVIPLWNGNNTVKVILIGSDKLPASAPLIAAVAANIEAKRPIGPVITVISATGVSVGVSANIVKNVAFTTQQVIDNVTAKINEYIKGAAFKDSYISYALIGSAILASAGVTDYNTLKINNAAVNIPIAAEQVATIGAVVLSVT